MGSSPTVRYITTGRVATARSCSTRPSKRCQQLEGPVRSDAYRGRGLFERDTAVPELNGTRSQENSDAPSRPAQGGENNLMISQAKKKSVTVQYGNARSFLDTFSDDGDAEEFLMPFSFCFSFLLLLFFLMLCLRILFIHTHLINVN